jgi:hypothetical protein
MTATITKPTGRSLQRTAAPRSQITMDGRRRMLLNAHANGKFEQQELR